MNYLHPRLYIVWCIMLSSIGLTVNVYADGDAININQESLNSQNQMTLSSAIKLTLQQNPQLHQFEFSRLRLGAESEISALKPAYQLGMDLENVAGTGEAKGTDSAEWTVSLSSTIELGDKQQSRIFASDAGLEKLEFEQQAQTLDVLGEMTRSFIQLLSTQHEQILADEAISLSKTLFMTVQKRAQQGAVSDAEVMRARANHVQSQIKKQVLQRRMQREKVSLARFWGTVDPGFIEAVGNLYYFGKSKTFQSLYSEVKHSPAINVLASESRLKEAEIKLAKSQNSTDLEWQVGFRRFESSGDTGLTLGLSIPLFSQSRNSGAVSAAMADRDAIELRRTENLLLLHEQLFTAYSQRQQFVDIHKQLNQQVIPELEKALKLTHKAYEHGRLTYQDWASAQQELLDARRQQIDAAKNALLNQSVIEQLTAVSLTNTH